MDAFRIDPSQIANLPLHLQDEVKRELDLYQRLIEANPLWIYQPHEKQKAFHESRTPIKLFLGGNRSGKTTAGVVDDIIQAVDESILPDHLLPYKKWQPPFYCRIIVPDFSRTLEVVYQKIREWTPREQFRGGSFEAAFDKQNRVLRFKNGSTFDFMTYEQDLDKFGGAAKHRIHADEEPPEDIRKESKARLVDYGGDEIFTMTPLQGLTYIWTAIYKQQHRPDITVVEVDMDDNPHIDEDAKQRFLEDLTPDEVKARKEGKFVHFHGMVYPEFNISRHVIGQVKKESLRGQDIVVGIDPGYRFTGLVWTAWDDENCGLVFDSVKLEQLTIDNVVEEINRRNTRWDVKPDYYVIDPSARNRTQHNAEAIEAEFQRFGIYTIHGQNDVEAGVQQVRRRLNSGLLLLTDENWQLIEEFQEYRIDPKSSPGEFKVMKVKDHIIDALRYVSMSRPQLGGSAPTRFNQRPAFQPGIAPPFTGNDGPVDDYPLGKFA